MSTAAKSDFRVDTKALEKQLEQALEEERDYRLRNEAKFRATAQKAATYEEFKGIVDLAHLHPLTNGDYKKAGDAGDKKTVEPWTPLKNL